MRRVYTHDDDVHTYLTLNLVAAETAAWITPRLIFFKVGDVVFSPGSKAGLAETIFIFGLGFSKK